MDRTPDLFGRTQQRDIFGIARRLHAEAAADVVGENPKPVGGEPHRAAQLTANAGDALSSAPQGEAPGSRIEARGPSTRLHGGDGDALVDEFYARDMSRARKDLVDL